MPRKYHGTEEGHCIPGAFSPNHKKTSDSSNWRPAYKMPYQFSKSVAVTETSRNQRSLRETRRLKATGTPKCIQVENGRNLNEIHNVVNGMFVAVQS